MCNLYSHTKGPKVIRDFVKVMKRPLALGLILVPILACAPLSPDSLRTDAGRSYSFTVSTDYEAVYENEQRAFLHCMTGSYYKMTFAIQPRINKQAKTATIIYVHHGAWTDFWAVVDMRFTDHGTAVTAYTTSHPLMSDFGQMTEKWANGSVECPASSPVTRQFQFSE